MAGKPLLVILGPTAVGKTGLAVELARALNGAIISADSRQIYRCMDIGTAKPTPDELALAPHHLLDIVNPDEHLALAQYQRLAYDHIDRLHAQGQLPLLVGGTGQYITAVIEGWTVPEVPPNAELRAELEAFAAAHGSEALHQRLAALDNQAAAQIDHRNVRRVVRALEVCLETGQPISRLQQKRPPPYSPRIYGLTLDRERLYARADHRFDAMIQAGLLDEVRQLLARGYSRRLPAMSGLGYAHLVRHLLDGDDLAAAVAQAKHDTHDFIRRQYTWFRGHDSGILWHNIEYLDRDILIEDLLRWARELS